VIVLRAVPDFTVDKETLKEVEKEVMPTKTTEVNLQAFYPGREEGQRGGLTPGEDYRSRCVPDDVVGGKVRRQQ